MTDSPFDPGLQPERTLLAWRRTSLAIPVAGLVLLRLELHHFGVLAICLALAALLMGGMTYAAATRRYRRIHDSLTAGMEMPAAGLALAFTALLVGCMACASLAWLMSGEV